MRLVARSIAALIPLAFSTAAMGQWKEVTEPSLGYTAAFPVKPEARAAV